MAADDHWLRVRRTDAGMTPKQLADAAGTNHQTIASIEAGQKDCPADLKRQIDLVLRDRMRRAEQAIRG